MLATPEFDPVELAALFARKDEPPSPPGHIAPLPTEPRDPSAIPRGEAALRAGEIAVLLVAGGQGSRLGFDKPKGMFPVGPVSGATLFQIHAEKVLALRKRYQTSIPFLVMTSPATHLETTEFFFEHQHFGLPKDEVFFFQQGTMPALDLKSGQVLLEAPGKPFLSPNGHGGVLTALATSGLLDNLKYRGIRHVFYFQVDNPLVNIADPAFLGRHIESNSEVSSKVVFKDRPEEKVGLLVLINGRCGIIEYSDLPSELAQARDPHGTLLYRAGNPAIHIFAIDFLEKVARGEHRLQYHIARKKVPYYDAEQDKVVVPECENALKFELFIFDALPMAKRWLAVETTREEEFAPLKNLTGHDSPATVRELMLAQARRWLGLLDGEVEISPLFALDAAEARAKLPSSFHITQPTYLR